MHRVARGWRVRIAVFVTSLLAVAACERSVEETNRPARPDDMCLAEGNDAKWTGDCIAGLAHGEGVASFPDSYFATIEGVFLNGYADGLVKIEYQGGGTYEGGWRNGEPHGYGRDIEPWGEGYEGGWIDGRRDGEGVYIAQDGRRIPATWKASVGLVGAWYADPETGCRLWWSPREQDPVGEARWSGACVDGKAHGAGTVNWRETTESLGGRPEPSMESFTGSMSSGYVEGNGRWTRKETFANLVRDEVFSGVWVDGVRSGYGERTENVVNTEVRRVLSRRTISRGEWKGDTLSGQGWSEETEERRDGGRNVVTSEGLFRGGRLNGLGRKEELTTEPDGSRSIDLAEGVFRDNNLDGSGVSTYSYASKDNSPTILSRIEGHGGGGGLTGFVTYDGGSRFEGAFSGDFYMPIPEAGACDIPEKSFKGECEIIWRERFSGSGRVACLAPKGKKRPCLVEVFALSH